MGLPLSLCSPPLNRQHILCQFLPPRRLCADSDRRRHPNGVHMKLANFRAVDPLHTSQGKRGLSRGGRGVEDVWVEFAERPAEKGIGGGNSCRRGFCDPSSAKRWFCRSVRRSVVNLPGSLTRTQSGLGAQEPRASPLSPIKTTVLRNTKMGCRLYRNPPLSNRLVNDSRQ